MAVITISRQVAALGDEIASALAKKLSYTFIDRRQIENRIVELGFPKDKLSKYDEKKPGFFASLVKDRDEYLNYLEYAVLEAASRNNCILIGRGSFVILEELENLVSLRFVADDEIRMERLKNEFNWNDKQARQRIEESDSNRCGFHKSFFNLENEDPKHFMLTLNTGILNVEESVATIEGVVKSLIDKQKEEAGCKKIVLLLKAQELVNRLLFEYSLNISFLRVQVQDKDTFILQGVAESAAVAQKALSLAVNVMPDYNIKSALTVVQDFKSC